MSLGERNQALYFPRWDSYYNFLQVSSPMAELYGRGTCARKCRLRTLTVRPKGLATVFTAYKDQSCAVGSSLILGVRAIDLGGPRGPECPAHRFGSRNRCLARALYTALTYLHVNCEIITL